MCSIASAVKVVGSAMEPERGIEPLTYALRERPVPSGAVPGGPTLSGLTSGFRLGQGPEVQPRPLPSGPVRLHAVCTAKESLRRTHVASGTLTTAVCVRYLDGMTETDQQQDLDPWMLVEEVQEQDPERALSAIGALRAWLEEMEEDAVVRGRAEGYPWGRIASCLGRSKQGVWEKHRDPGESLGDETGELAS